MGVQQSYTHKLKDFNFAILDTLRCEIVHFTLLRGMIAIYLRAVCDHKEYRVAHALSAT